MNEMDIMIIEFKFELGDWLNVYNQTVLSFYIRDFNYLDITQIPRSMKLKIELYFYMAFLNDILLNVFCLSKFFFNK
jgi:hypothetical protein